ncbi:MAG TPA: Lsr2 family protein [Microbacteriaceae bacterium]|nr:Lsr2 family protein [Microbacteriaceae bacterium]
MAIKTVLIDDFDATPLPASAATTTFALNGVQYEIDLSPANVAKLQDALAPFIKAGRRVGSATGRASAAGKRRPASRSDLGAIREWAQANGYKVGDRGRIPADIVEAYSKR